MNLIFRKAIETDIIYMTSIYNESINIFPENIRKDADNDLFVQIFNSNIVYIAEELSMNKIIGWITYNIQSNYAFIIGIYLLTNSQRKGVGSKLLGYCINTLKKENCKLIILNVLKNAPWSIEFYKKNGFIVYDSNICYDNDLYFLKTKIVNNWELLVYKKL